MAVARTGTPRAPGRRHGVVARSRGTAVASRRGWGSGGIGVVVVTITMAGADAVTIATSWQGRRLGAHGAETEASWLARRWHC